MTTRAVPSDSDIIVQEEGRTGGLVYTLRTASGPEQLTMVSYESAVDWAVAFAKRVRARVWVETDGDFELLTDVADDHGVLVGETTSLPPVERLRAEFLEMPGMRLTATQVQRLCGVERLACESVLDTLVSEKFLCANADGTYARWSDGGLPFRRAAKADLKNPASTRQAS